MSWVTWEPKSTTRILSCSASRWEPPPDTREESRRIIAIYVRGRPIRSRPCFVIVTGELAFAAPPTAPSSPHEHGNVEPVGLGTARGHQYPLPGCERSGTEDMRVLKRGRNIGRRDKGKIPLPR